MDSNNIQKDGLAEKKDWIKKLEELTGKPLELSEQKKNTGDEELNLYKDYHQPGYVYILLDTSGSMNTREKISRAKRGAISFIEKAFKRNFKTGIIDFSLKAEVVVRPSTDLKELESRVKKIKASGPTNLTSALKLAWEEFENLNGKKVTYVITDGKPDNKNTSLKIAKRLKEERVHIMTLGTDDADQEFLEQLSSGEDLNRMTSRKELEAEISSMASLLPVDNE
ncbi:MAG: vWA domain-containing protein [Halanaerobiales bacterium]